MNEKESPVEEKEEDLFPLPYNFRVIPKYNLELEEYFDKFGFDLSKKTLDLEICENCKFDIFDWLSNLKEDEVLTFISFNEKKEIICMLRFCNLKLLHHECIFSKVNNFMGGAIDQSVFHEVKLSFENIDRVKREIDAKSHFTDEG